MNLDIIIYLGTIYSTIEKAQWNFGLIFWAEYHDWIYAVFSNEFFSVILNPHELGSWMSRYSVLNFWQKIWNSAGLKNNLLLFTDTHIHVTYDIFLVLYIWGSFMVKAMNILNLWNENSFQQTRMSMGTRMDFFLLLAVTSVTLSLVAYRYWWQNCWYICNSSFVHGWSIKHARIFADSKKNIGDTDTYSDTFVCFLQSFRLIDYIISLYICH